MAASDYTDVPGVSAAQALDIRKRIYAHGAPLTPSDMELVFQTARNGGPAPSPEWIQLFSEAVSDYVVHQNDPPDYIPQGKADWLMAMLKKGGGIASATEFAMLIDVMNSALGAPPSLSAFALEEIKAAVLSGRRSAIGGADDHPAGVVTKSDVEALRSVLFAATAGSPGHVTREEAEVLFDIAHAVADKKSDPSFDDLFARAVGNCLMAITLHVPSSEEALEREHWLDEREHLTGFFSRLVAHGQIESFNDTLKTPLEAADDDMAAQLRADAMARGESETITPSEADWVLSRLTRKGALTSAESRLLKWLAAEAHALPPGLRAVVDEAQAAKARAA